jgi:dipeptidyl aminopeptidase/acylaminoacyl peptidase
MSVALPLTLARAQSPAVALPDSNSRLPVGWYELAPGHKALVTWAPEAGELRMLDFDSLAFHRLVPATDTGYVWRRGSDTANRVVTFVRRDDGEVTGLRWTGTNGASGLAQRAREFPFQQRQVRFRNDSVELVGTLLLPRIRKLVGRPGRMVDVPITLPGAVIIHGSGASDRDNVWAFHIAQHMARNGIAVLIPDKRGSGASGGDWRTADFVALAGDAIAAARELGADPRVDPHRVGFVGLSQGGWIAPLAATRGEGAFAVDVSGAAVTPAEQVRHEVRQDLTRDGVPDSLAQQVLDLLALSLEHSGVLSDTSWERYATKRNDMLNGPLADAMTSFPAARDHWRFAWWRAVGDFDPVPYWRDLNAPALVVYGALDENDNVPVAESVNRLRDALAPERKPSHRIRVFPGMGHTLVDPGTGWISSAFLDLLSTWIIEAVGREHDARKLSGGKRQ